MIALDGHTHIYPIHDLDVLLRSAFAESRRAAGIGGDGRWAGGLLLAESRGHDSFGRMVEIAGKDVGGERPWSVSRTAERYSLRLGHADFPGQVVYLFAGRQLVTREGIEVLALLAEHPPEEGASLDRTVRSTIDRGGIAVCPWGAGKWLGGRGRTVAAFAREYHHPGFFLGDSALRPRLWSSPLLRRHLRAGGRLLSGSDSLPMPGEERRAGSFGSMVAGQLDGERPAASLLAILNATTTMTRPFGRRLGFFTFCTTQFQLRRGKSRRHRQ